jgi:hypothetical protein
MKPKTLLGAIALELASCGCGPLQIPGVQEACGSIVVAPGIRVTAGHCPTYGEPLRRVDDADLQFVTCSTALKPQPLQLAPTEAGSSATLRGKEFVIIDPLRLSDGHLFLLAWPELDPGDSGFGLWQDGKLVGMAIGNVENRAVFVAAGEVSRQLRTLPSEATAMAYDPPIRINPMERSAP